MAANTLTPRYALKFKGNNRKKTNAFCCVRRFDVANQAKRLVSTCEIFEKGKGEMHSAVCKASVARTKRMFNIHRQNFVQIQRQSDKAISTASGDLVAQSWSKYQNLKVIRKGKINRKIQMQGITSR
jgi:hypothetical protein